MSDDEKEWGGASVVGGTIAALGATQLGRIPGRNLTEEGVKNLQKTETDALKALEDGKINAWEKHINTAITGEKAHPQLKSFVEGFRKKGSAALVNEVHAHIGHGTGTIGADFKDWHTATSAAVAEETKALEAAVKKARQGNKPAQKKVAAAVKALEDGKISAWEKHINTAVTGEKAHPQLKSFVEGFRKKEGAALVNEVHAHIGHGTETIGGAFKDWHAGATAAVAEDVKTLESALTKAKDRVTKATETLKAPGEYKGVFKAPYKGYQFGGTVTKVALIAAIPLALWLGGTLLRRRKEESYADMVTNQSQGSPSPGRA